MVLAILTPGPLEGAWLALFLPSMLYTLLSSLGSSSLTLFFSASFRPYFELKAKYYVQLEVRSALGFVAGVTPKSHFSVVQILDGLFSSRGKRKREKVREEGMEKGRGKSK